MKSISLNRPASAEPRFKAVRLNGRRPILTRLHFLKAGADACEANNINGPCVIRVPEWIPPHERPARDARYYMYFAHHGGSYIRMAYAGKPAGPWHLFNTGDAVDRSLGDMQRSIPPRRTPGNGVLDLGLSDSREIDTGHFRIRQHIASPDVRIDHEGKRLAMYFHAPISAGGQKTFVATSRYGLNFNNPSEGGECFADETGGIRDVIPGWFYFRTFEVAGRSFAYSNCGKLYRSPARTADGERASLANADEKGGLWKPRARDQRAEYWEEIEAGSNPVRRLYRDQGREETAPRHFAVVHDADIDPDKIFVIYTARSDAPERILLTVLDLGGLKADERVHPATWRILVPHQHLLLEPEESWEGGDLPITPSRDGSATNVRELRDPFVLKDEGHLYLYYSGRGEEAIGIAELRVHAR